MLSRGYRLASQRDLRETLRHGRRFSDSSLELFVRRSGLPISRFGCGVRSGVYRRAVDRNQWKRVAREVVRRSWHRVVPGFDLLLLVRVPVTPCSFRTCETPILDLLRHASALS